MRRFIIFAAAILLVFVAVGIAGGVGLAKTGPFLPGNLLFPFQHFAEQTQVRLESQTAQQTRTYFFLAERRLENLATQTGTTHESTALQYLNTALDQAVQSWSILPLDSADTLRGRLLILISHSEIVTNQLKMGPTQDPNIVTAFLAKLSILRKLAEDPLVNPAILASLVERDGLITAEEIPAGADAPNATIDPLAVPFPPGSLASEHAFYPLIGQHAQIECINCHTDGVYEGTPVYCEACHAGAKPQNHYVGDCAACHSAFAWSDITFDHTLVNTSDCASCHLANKPANHYGNQCTACHNTSAWQPANFNHQAAGATDCKACHTNSKPANHFSGQCSRCHATNTWQGAEFNHSGQTDCQSCHSGDKPSDHFSGQCSACHSTNTWEGASFNHSGQTACKSCHRDDKPSNHFSGQCSACHSTDNWDAEFNHNGQTDCKSCHSGDKPSNHFSRQCSACHSTNGWGGASFSHNGQTDCKSCHSGDKPSNHFRGQCSQCHTTDDWDAEFSHSGQSDCKSCHTGDRPGDHDGGQCSQCHSTSDWDADEDDDGDEEDDDDDGDEDDDDDEDDKDDEQGSLDLTSMKIATSTHSPLECGACHTQGTVANETGNSNTNSSWWREFLMLLQNMVPISIG